MRVAVDAHALGSGAGGNESYVRALLESLALRCDVATPTALVAPDWNGALPEGTASRRLRTRSSWLRVAADLPLLLRAGAFDLFHAQYIAPPWGACPAVASIHDFVWKRHPETLPPLTRRRLQFLIPQTLKRVRRVFVLSEAMRAELVAFYGFPEDRIDVVAPAVDARFTAPLEEDAVEAARDKYGLPETYLLYAGALQPRKNLDRLFEAYAKARREGAPARLVVAGRKAWMTDSLSQTLHRLELENDVVFTGYVDDPDLPALMRGARAFAYVSVYEGFGIPVIEAMACGTPVLTSGIGALAEVAGDGAATCDPLDVDAIAAGLTAVAGDETLRARLRLAGPRRAARYSHQAMADAAAAGYARALEGA